MTSTIFLFFFTQVQSLQRELSNIRISLEKLHMENRQLLDNQHKKDDALSTLNNKVRTYICVFVKIWNFLFSCIVKSWRSIVIFLNVSDQRIEREIIRLHRQVEMFRKTSQGAGRYVECKMVLLYFEHKYSLKSFYI